ncbi:hypothetical protein AYO41_03300 [Verrucomicrobia bacterium SCGC AG-212-E04]|nr:hypothetical protein AYO41_03300 [Verrucomicrobia bacterium SCGC AG-212-E04]
MIDLSEQQAYFFKGKLLVGVSPVSTGKEGTNTPKGHFRIIQKDINHVSNLFGDYVDERGVVVMKNIGVREDRRPRGAHFDGAPMPYFMRIVAGIGMHEGYLPGVPASHGCIRLPAEMAQAFYYAADIGTPVQIKP